MNLEAIEQRVLAYLDDVANPLVRIEVLHAHLADHALADGMTVAQLRDFLVRHDRVRVLEPPAGGVDSDLSDEPSGSYAIAKDRVPTQAQLAGMMREQLDILLDALRAAREEAADRGDHARLAQIDQARQKATALRDKFGGDRPENVVDFRQN